MWLGLKIIWNLYLRTCVVIFVVFSQFSFTTKLSCVWKSLDLCNWPCFLWYKHVTEFSKIASCPDQCGFIGWASSLKAHGCLFDSWSWHMPRLLVQSPVGARARGNWSLFLSHVDVSLSFSLPSPASKNK